MSGFPVTWASEASGQTPNKKLLLPLMNERAARMNEWENEWAKRTKERNEWNERREWMNVVIKWENEWAKRTKERNEWTEWMTERREVEN